MRLRSWDAAVGGSEKLLLLAIEDHLEDGVAALSLADLRRLTGLGEQTCRRALRGLEAAGLVVVDRTPGARPSITLTPTNLAPPPNWNPCHHGTPTPTTTAPPPCQNGTPSGAGQEGSTVLPDDLPPVVPPGDDDDHHDHDAITAAPDPDPALSQPEPEALTVEADPAIDAERWARLEAAVTEAVPLAAGVRRNRRGQVRGFMGGLSPREVDRLRRLVVEHGFDAVEEEAAGMERAEAPVAMLAKRMERRAQRVQAEACARRDLVAPSAPVDRAPDPSRASENGSRLLADALADLTARGVS